MGFVMNISLNSFYEAATSFSSVVASAALFVFVSDYDGTKRETIRPLGEMIPPSGLETSLVLGDVSLPNRVPIPREDERLVLEENAYRERDPIDRFVSGLGLRGSITKGPRPKREMRPSKVYRKVPFHRAV